MPRKKYQKPREIKTEPQPVPEIQVPQETAANDTLLKAWVPSVVLFILAFLLYGQTISYEFALDDSIVVSENIYTKKGISGLGKIFTTDAFEGYFQQRKKLVSGGRYRPLSVATFAIEAELAGKKDKSTGMITPKAGISHFGNVVLYGLTGIFLYLVLCQMLNVQPGGKWWLSLPFLITIVYLAHPIHTEAVANIKGRDELMAFLFVLISMFFLFRFADKKNMVHLGLASLIFFAACLSKETALTFIVVIPAALVYFRRKMNFASLALPIAALVVPTLLYFLLRFAFIGTPEIVNTGEILNDPFIHATWMERMATISHTMGIYLLKIFFPHHLTHDYYFNQVPVIGPGELEAIVPAIIMFGMIIYSIYGFIKNDKASFGILFYLVTISIVSNVFVSIGTTMGERFVYVSSFGLVFALFVKAQDLVDRKKLSVQHLAIAAGAITLIFAVQTVIRNPAWRNNESLFLTDVHNSPNSAKVQTAAGGTLVDLAEKEFDQNLKTQMLNEALVYLNNAIRIYPDHGNAWLLKGNAYHMLGNYQEALNCYQKTIYYRPGFIDALKNAAITAVKMERNDLAARYYLKATTINANDPTIWMEMGLAYDKAARPDSAIYAYENVLRLKPDDYMALGNIGMIYGRNLGQFDKAIEYTQKALKLKPGEEWLYENLGIAYASRQDFGNALKTFNEGLMLNPNSIKMNRNLGITYMNMGDPENGMKFLQKAEQLEKGQVQ